MQNINPEPGSALQRRTLVQGAAWTIPAVAVATAAPMAAASGTDPWDVAITSGCSFNVPGSVFLFNGFRVAADPNTVQPQNVLQITETGEGTFTYSWPSPVPPIIGAGPQNAADAAIRVALEAVSFAYATTMVALVIAQATLNAVGNKVNAPLWVIPNNILEFASFTQTLTYTGGTGLGRTAHLEVVFDISRIVTVTGLNSGETTGWGYIGAILPPQINSLPAWNIAMATITAISGGLGLPVVIALNAAAASIVPELTLTAVGNWTDADNVNHAGAQMGNDVLQNGC
ncbi:hypothetical protein HQQ81_21710 [Microbacteriaceae bacterium VKM Ac-2854]|nr:hypothetical protein [Microbacteriaceae bacterium VKM Ac-2854]